jgi:ketosteroid isomerase-like protein
MSSSSLTRHSGLRYRQKGYMQDEREIHALFEAGDRALMAADVDTLDEIFAEDYVQYDTAGKPYSKSDVLRIIQNGAVRYPIVASTGRTIRLFGEMAIVHGSESDEVESDGRRFSVQYLYMDVVCKRGGRWQIVGSQLVKPEI